MFYCLFFCFGPVTAVLMCPHRIGFGMFMWILFTSLQHVLFESNEISLLVSHMYYRHKTKTNASDKGSCVLVSMVKIEGIHEKA